ncbi:MAG: DUF2147 domain-containing protein [Proteobacteria bacterium]|nr:DUF2147 domain-containing protein [Pseudomonadota bacterium]
MHKKNRDTSKAISRMKYIPALALLLCLPVTAGETINNTEGNRILGVWATEKAEAHVEIAKGDNGYKGTIVWLKEPFYIESDSAGRTGEVKKDTENPEPSLRDRNIVGLQIMEGFEYGGNDRWINGTIYDPENGETYKCRMMLTHEGALKVRGYVGISLFGRTSEWTPVLKRVPVESD